MFENQRSAQSLLQKSLLSVTLMMTIGVFVSPSVHAQNNAPASNIRKPLDVEIEHDEKVPGLAPEYQVGNRIDPTQLTALSPDNLWFPIPSWLAGKWHSENMTVTNVTNCLTGQSAKVHLERKEVADVVHGFQKDKSGQVWEFLQIPRVQKVSVDNGQCYLTCSREDVLRTDSTAVLLKILNNQITVDKKNKVLATEQVQQISNYLPLEDGIVRMEASLKNFDADGDPQQVQKAEKVIQRIAPYEAIDSKDGLDLKQLFVEFLKKNGKEDLVPDNLKAKL
ncbi:MAG: hypothetical protein P4L53_00830 [Candidatus Obscuribacterales bacterium]|nr:hypothetical protein [Candidatus Obscuribacterales bacterium]